MVSVEGDSPAKSDEAVTTRSSGESDVAEIVNGDSSGAGSIATEQNGGAQQNGSPVNCSEPDVKPTLTRESSTTDGLSQLSNTPSCETAAKKAGLQLSGRGVTIEMLLKDGFVKPGSGALLVELDGKKRKGTLLKNGHIQDETSDTTFTSVSAWAIHACNALSPSFKPLPGTTWCSQIRHKGKCLDHYRNQWFHTRQDKHKRGDFGDRTTSKKKRIVRPEEAVVRPGCEPDRDLLVQCQPFQRYGKMQPFNVTVSLGAYILMDLHSSITMNEVSGYLGGSWDVNNHIVHIKAAYPCRCRPGDTDNAPMVEYDIAMNMDKAKHSVVGWYHSHPQFSPYPSIGDVESQLEYQMKMKGSNDAAYTPCVGMITTPFQEDSTSLETIVSCFWVMPPPETRPMDPPLPMLLEYLPVPEPLLDRDVEETKLLFEFYKDSSEFINSVHILRDEITYWDKLETTLKPKLMAAENGEKVWDVIHAAFIEPDESNTVEHETEVKEEALATDGEAECPLEEKVKAVPPTEVEEGSALVQEPSTEDVCSAEDSRVEQENLAESNASENPPLSRSEDDVPLAEPILPTQDHERIQEELKNASLDGT